MVLTLGDRPEELGALVDSLGEPTDFEGIVVGNGVVPNPVRGWVGLATPENLGISGGRRHGAAHASGAVLVFIDDDCRTRTPAVLHKIAEAFADDRELGALALRIVVSGTDDSLREWLPWIGRRRSQDRRQVTSFTGGAHAIRAAAYVDVGGYHPDFWYAHEETDLAWRLLDAGWAIEYRPDLVVEHPPTKPARHDQHLWYSARNRIWLGRQHLPLPVAACYVSIWLAVQLARSRRRSEWRQVLAGTAAGIRSSPGPRRPMRWRTVWRMARLGRPPLI